MKKFWMVYGEGRSCPTFKHETYNSACEEAKRLTELNPKSTFWVLEAIYAFESSIVISESYIRI